MVHRQHPQNAAALPPSRTQDTRASLKVTSVQHDVVDHVAFVFGVIEAERAAEIFGAFLWDCRMPSFHVHSKSRSKREGTETMTVADVSPAGTPLAGVHRWRPCLRSLN